jgi:hypothetical protein
MMKPHGVGMQNGFSHAGLSARLAGWAATLLLAMAFCAAPRCETR